MNRRLSLATVLFLLAPAGARAQPLEDPPPARINPPAPEVDADPVPPPLAVLPVRRMSVRLLLTSNLARGAVAKPVSLAPDLAYGAADDLTIAIVHSSLGITGFWGGAEASLCLTGKRSGCPEFYRRGGLQARLQVFRRTRFAAALVGGVFVRDVDPFAVALKGGVATRTALSARLTLAFDPTLLFAVNERDSGQTEELNLPVTLHWQPMEVLGVLLQGGLATPLDSAGDLFRVPVTVAATYWVTPAVGASCALSLPALLGGDKVADGFDLRAVTVGLFWNS